MAGTRMKQAFTLIELLVVVAIIALLISILLPSLQGARDQGKKAVCLTNLRSISQASHAYSNEDKRELLIPMHRMHVRPDHATGFLGGWWGWRTAQPHSYGGRTPTKGMPTASGVVTVMLAPNDTTDNYMWGAITRPLNKYIYTALNSADFKNMPMYRCPCDVGFPKFNPADWGGVNSLDAPPEAAGMPMYDIMGNSFRINTCGLVWINGAMAVGAFTVGAEGHQSSVIEQPSRTVSFCEPLFYFWSRQQPGSTPNPEVLLFPGWHKRIMSDDVAFCDGSAKTARINQLAVPEQTLLDQMHYTPDFPWYYFMRRGKTWQTDCFPAPGGFILVYNNANAVFDSSLLGLVRSYTGWPFENYRVNQPPE